MTGIYLSPKMVERAAESGCYNVLAVGNAESVVLPPATADLPPALNAPCYADVKVRVVFVNVNVNVNVNGGRNGNDRCGGGGGMKEEKDYNGGGGGGGVGGGGEKRCFQQQCPYFDKVLACHVLLYIADLRSLLRSVWDSLSPPPPYDSRREYRRFPDGGDTRWRKQRWR